MKRLAGISAVGGAALTALCLILTPALATPGQQKRARSVPPPRAATFTPAVADPRLAAELARRGLNGSSFRFTPASAAANRKEPVRVAVRARAATPAQAIRTLADSSASPVTAVTPTAYNLGASVGWRSFAISGDVAEVKGGAVPGGRRNAEVNVSYTADRFTGRIEVGADDTEGAQSRVVPVDSSYSVGVGGSFRVARNIDVTGGVRYRMERDKLEPVSDQRRDSQAVYVGTAFRF